MMDSGLFNRRLEMLKTEVDLDFTDLVNALEKGLKVVVVTEPFDSVDLDPDVLRRIGGMAMLCRHYGAVVIFADECTFGEVNNRITRLI